MNSWTHSRPAWLAAGAVLGLVVGLNVSGVWPSIPLHATATQGLDKFAIATGLVDDSVEAVYFLDFLTGDLRAAVINPKNGKFNSFFHAKHCHRLWRHWHRGPLLDCHRFCRHAARPGELPICQEHRLCCRGRQRAGGSLYDPLELRVAGSGQTVQLANSNRST